MITKGLKLMAARKRIPCLIDEQGLVPFAVPVKTVGIIFDNRNKKALEVLQELKTKISPGVEIKTALFTERGVETGDFDGIRFNLKDFGYKGEILNEKLLQFTSEGVDLLITFAEENSTPAHLLTAYCKAGIKVGRYQRNKSLYHLILQTEDDAELFVEELLKYLKKFKNCN